MSLRNSAAAQSGFTLIEVLVALLVISIGLLGIAKMQALALASTGTARMRSVAAIEAASMASMMHADRAYWSAIPSGTTETVTVKASNGSFTTSDTTVAAPPGCTATAPTPCCTSTLATPCTAAQVADQDLTFWSYDLKQTMPPNATATIICPGVTVNSSSVVTAPVSCTVEIFWTENLVDINTGMNSALTAKQNATNLQTTAPTHFLLYVEP
jgi:type IV pilus assembly protein PilV